MRSRLLKKKSNMKAYSRSRNLFFTALWVVMIVLRTSCQCGASDTISVNIHNTTTTITSVCSGKECLIAQQDVDLELQMPSEITRRVLAKQNNPITYAISDPNNPNRVCGFKGSQCTGDPSGSKYIKDNIGTYHRGPI
uniref:Uncharacterized protein n=1 Tax=Cannabis sativa TaxID=3483 RepID=A0A803RB96_CANSA